MKVGINGIGIAGPTLAYWLREYGHEPVLFDRAAELRTEGYVTDFWGLGYNVAERMGLIDPLREQATEQELLRSTAKRTSRICRRARASRPSS